MNDVELMRELIKAQKKIIELQQEVMRLSKPLMYPLKEMNTIGSGLTSETLKDLFEKSKV